TQMFCSPAWLGQKAAFYASVRETNRRPFGHGVVAIYFGLYWIINTLDLLSLQGEKEGRTRCQSRLLRGNMLLLKAFQLMRF
ncbi:hypothetical protein P4S95_26945, partial [Aneurinibacillus aneurinilyticus]|uniref:hypothetical protein n=1 Tax=Aneurinibacillus aneurinilyticus TaxID=1391 RepID=UPI002E24D0DA|nr:hypothetical protein [Aneurinibacillus aneurinilyticus]